MNKQNVFVKVNGILLGWKFLYENSAQLKDYIADKMYWLKISPEFSKFFGENIVLRDRYFNGLIRGFEESVDSHDSSVFNYPPIKGGPKIEIVYGKDATEDKHNIPRYSFNEDEYLYKEYDNYVSDSIETDRIPVSFATFSKWTYSFEPIIEDFQEFLIDFVGTGFLYDFWKGNLAYIEPSNVDSVRQFVYDLNSWTTKGYRNNNNFDFDSEKVVAVVDYQKAISGESNEFVELLQKIIVVENRRLDYSFKDLFGPDSHPASIVTNFCSKNLKEFLSDYLVVLGYYEFIQKVDLATISQEERDLSFYLVQSCLGLNGEDCQNIEKKYLAYVSR
jgi:hypothetical protein